MTISARATLLFVALVVPTASFAQGDPEETPTQPVVAAPAAEQPPAAPTVLPPAPTPTVQADVSPDPASRFSATVILNQDIFFGFYPILSASLALKNWVHLAFYSILWTTPSFSFNSGGGGLWTEVGLGVRFTLFKGALSIGPQLGILNGTLLSGSATPLAAEGVVPNITINYAGRYAEGEVYFGYYLATRGARENDFIHYWANAGFKPTGFLRRATHRDLLSIGLHWEHLRHSRSVSSTPSDLYKWLGPYVQLSLPLDIALRFVAGVDFGGPQRAEFYKAMISKSF